MKVAVVGSRGLRLDDLSPYLPKGTTEIVSGGAKGIDRCAATYAKSHDLILTEFLPNYARYGRGAPIIRNQEIVAYADYVLIFWDGASRGSLSVIHECEKRGRLHRVICE